MPARCGEVGTLSKGGERCRTRPEHDRWGGTEVPRVLLVAPEPFFRLTGTPINVLQLCRALTSLGLRVDLLTLPFGEDVEISGLAIRRVTPLPWIDEVPVGFSLAKVAYDVLLMPWAFWLLLRRRYACVHAVEEAAFFAAPLARLFGVAAITDLDSDLAQQLAEHPSRSVRALAAPARWCRKQALRLSTCALSVAGQMTTIARNESPDTPVFEIRDIPIDEALRPPDPARLAAAKAELELPNRRLIVYTGNYDPRQGLRMLIAALPTVLDRHPEVALVIVGGQPREVAAMQVEVDRAGLGSAVRLVGERPLDTMAEYMGMADVLASPRLEAYATPLKIFSYMASGRPIVATDLPTHTSVLDARAAFLVPPDARGLARGLIEALDDPHEAARRGANARRRVEERHTFEIFREELLAAYTFALASSGRQGRQV